MYFPYSAGVCAPGQMQTDPWFSARCRIWPAASGFAAPSAPPPLAPSWTRLAPPRPRPALCCCFCSRRTAPPPPPPGENWPPPYRNTSCRKQSRTALAGPNLPLRGGGTHPSHFVVLFLSGGSADRGAGRAAPMVGQGGRSPRSTAGTAYRYHRPHRRGCLVPLVPSQQDGGFLSVQLLQFFHAGTAAVDVHVVVTANFF